MMSLRLVYYYYTAVCVLSGVACAWVLPALPPMPPALVIQGTSATAAAVVELGTAASAISSSSISGGSLFLGVAAAGAAGTSIADMTDTGKGFIKVYLVSSATELEAVQFIDFDRSKVPKVPFDLNYIKNMVEKEVGSSAKLEYFYVNKWVPLTNMSDLANYKRLAKFDYMSVVPLRVPSQYVGDDDIDGVRYSRR